VLLALVGAASNVCVVTNRTLLQLNCDPPYLGRLMSAYVMIFGLTQLGTMPVGAVADALGVPLVITVQGALFAAVFVVVWALGARSGRSSKDPAQRGKGASVSALHSASLAGCSKLPNISPIGNLLTCADSSIISASSSDSFCDVWEG
jgi:hypothetical protein